MSSQSEFWLDMIFAEGVKKDLPSKECVQLKGANVSTDKVVHSKYSSFD